MTREIMMYQSEHEKIIKMLTEIEGISSLCPRTLEDARINLEIIKDLVFKLHNMMRISGHS